MSPSQARMQEDGRGYDCASHLRGLWDWDSMFEMLQEKQTAGNQATAGGLRPLN